MPNLYNNVITLQPCRARAKRPDEHLVLSRKYRTLSQSEQDELFLIFHDEIIAPTIARLHSNFDLKHRSEVEDAIRLTREEALHILDMRRSRKLVA